MHIVCGELGNGSGKGHKMIMADHLSPDEDICSVNFYSTPPDSQMQYWGHVKSDRKQRLIFIMAWMIVHMRTEGWEEYGILVSCCSINVRFSVENAQ